MERISNVEQGIANDEVRDVEAAKMMEKEVLERIQKSGTVA
jgi:hypothetical protein